MQRCSVWLDSRLAYALTVIYRDEYRWLQRNTVRALVFLLGVGLCLLGGYYTGVARYLTPTVSWNVSACEVRPLAAYIWGSMWWFPLIVPLMLTNLPWRLTDTQWKQSVYLYIAIFMLYPFAAVALAMRHLLSFPHCDVDDRSSLQLMVYIGT